MTGIPPDKGTSSLKLRASQGTGEMRAIGTTAAQQLGVFCAAVRWDGLPADVQRRATELTLDLIGVTVRGALEPSTGPIRAVVRSHPSRFGSSGVGLRRRIVPSSAALLNGSAAHAVELDDVTRESSLHPGVAVIPAALAIAEEHRASGRALLEAVVAGYEVVIRVGNALNPASAYARGFHPTGVAGAFGAAAASARLLGLDGAGITRSIGIAGTMASGSLEYLSDGSWTKRLNAGWAAHAGVIAAELAQAGFTGPVTALEGRLGVLHAYSDAPQAELLLDGLGDAYQITRVAIKPYACCRYNHGLIDGVLRIRAEIGADPASVRRIRLGVLSAGALLVADPIEQKRAPKNSVDAQFSAPFAAAVAFLHGAAGTQQFVQDLVDDPRVRTLMALTDCYTSDALDARYPAHWPAVVEIETLDGRTHRAEMEFALGEPENPVSEDGLRAKFRQLVGDTLPERVRRELEEACLGLDEADDVDVIATALRRVRTADA